MFSGESKQRSLFLASQTDFCADDQLDSLIPKQGARRNVDTLLDLKLGL